MWSVPAIVIVSDLSLKMWISWLLCQVTWLWTQSMYSDEEKQVKSGVLICMFVPGVLAYYTKARL